MAEGSPAELKRAIGSDVIIAKIDGETADAALFCERIAGVSSVSVHADELTLSVADGARLIGPVAIALDQYGANVQELILRTPTLDDVFLHYSGARLGATEDARRAEEAA